MEEDKKAAALQLALENAQDLEDERNAVALSADEKLEVIQYVQELTIVEATGDEEADKAAREAALEIALEYQADEKALMDSLRRAAKGLKKELGDEAQEYLDAQVLYYTQRAKYEAINGILGQTNTADAAAQAEVDRARFGGELDDYIKEEYRETIAGYEGWAATGDAAADAEAGNTLLAKLEDDAQFDLAVAQRKMDKKGTDKTKQAYYDALERYEFLSAELGPNSPAKAAEAARKVEAAAKAALQELTASLAKATTLQDVVKYIAKASKNTSPLPELLGEARTYEGMQEVLALVAEDEKMAELLATGLLAAETEDAAA